MNTKALMIASPASNHGKTMITTALAANLAEYGHTITIAKCGPDYIDASYHALIPNATTLNLDPWAMSSQTLHTLLSSIPPSSFLIVEAATGLFDGALDGTGSPAALAETFSIPIALVVDVRGMGASIAALIEGFLHHKTSLAFTGIILNRVASNRHLHILSQAIQHLPIPLLAAIPNDPTLSVPHRHLGLTMAHEHPLVLQKWKNAFPQNEDIKKCISAFKTIPPPQAPSIQIAPPLGKHIAIARDNAFLFIYPHFIQDWLKKGITLSFFSPLANETPDPHADAIFLPGGYPELHLPQLSESKLFFQALQDAANKNIWIYGECGGFMVLGNSIINNHGQEFSMAGLLPFSTSFQNPKRTLGYRNISLLNDTPLGKKHALYKGHEFHYTQIIHTPKLPNLFLASDALRQNPSPQGFQKNTVIGSYIHLISPS
jgi:cobyrinic acid a,c-diamide synthase